MSRFTKGETHTVEDGGLIDVTALKASHNAGKIFIGNIENAIFNLVDFIDGIPHCRKHGAMNKTTKEVDGGGIWRCLAVHSIQKVSNGQGGYGKKECDCVCRAGCLEVRIEKTPWEAPPDWDTQRINYKRGQLKQLKPYTINMTIPPPSENQETQRFLKVMENSPIHVLDPITLKCYTCGTHVEECALIKK